MKVHYVEGVAIQDGPEPFAGIREDVGEALVGEHAGQPSSRERDLISDADAVPIAEGNMGGALCECLTNPARSLDPGMHGRSFAREPGVLRVGHGLFGGHGPQREGDEP